MNRNEITLQEMFSLSHRGTPGRRQVGTAHIYQSAVNAFSAFTKWQPMPMRKLSPTVLKRFENFLRQRNCSWNTVSTYIKTVRSVYHRAVDRKYIRYVPRLFEHVYRHTGGQEEGARSIRHQQPGKGRRKGACKEGRPKHTAENKGFSSYSCSCSGAYPSWTWRTCTKGTCRGMCCLTEGGRRDGR